VVGIFARAITTIDLLFSARDEINGTNSTALPTNVGKRYYPKQSLAQAAHLFGMAYSYHGIRATCLVR